MVKVFGIERVGADLHYYDFASDEAHRVIGIPKQRHPDFWHSRPVCLSRDGRYLATSLTKKMLRGVSKKKYFCGRARAKDCIITN